MQHHGLFLLHLSPLAVIEASLAHVAGLKHGLQRARIHTSHRVLYQENQQQQQQQKECISGICAYKILGKKSQTMSYYLQWEVHVHSSHFL